MRALEKLQSFRGEAELTTWLHRILHNFFVDHLRRAREAPVEDVWEVVEERWRDDSYTLDAAAVASSAETAGDLRDARLRLPMECRSAVVLHDMEGLTVPEIAGIQEIGLSAAKQRVRRGRMMLVSALAAGAERRAASRDVPLDCWDARTQLPDYLDDELDARVRRRLEQHLRRCPTCPPLYAAVVASRDAVSRLRDSDAVIPASLAARLEQMRADATERPR